MKRNLATILLVSLLLGGSFYMHLKAEGEPTPCAQVKTYRAKLKTLQSKYPALSERVTDENRASLLAALSSEVADYESISPPALARSQYLLSLDTFRDFQAILAGKTGDGDFDADFAGDKRAQAALSSACP